MSIEDELARDIAIVTGGVVVTEQEMSDAREAVAERIVNEKKRDRRRVLVAVAAAAVVIPVVAVAAVRAVGGEETVQPAGPVPSEDGFLTGDAPTKDDLQGVWRVDNGTTAIRFSAPDLVAFDDSGQLFGAPAVLGTYDLDDDQITVYVEGGRAHCGPRTYRLRASVPETGSLHVVQEDPSTDSCPVLAGAAALEQVAPAGPAVKGLVFSQDEGWQPLTGPDALPGLWAAEGGGYALEMDPGGAYFLVDESGEAVDRGQWSVRGSDLTLTSSAASITCSTGDRLVLRNVQTEDPGPTTALRGTVATNTCDAGWTPKAWFRIPHLGSD